MRKKGDELLVHEGILSFETIGHLLAELKARAKEREVPQGVYKRLLIVTIESLENIYKYREHFEDQHHLMIYYPPFFTIKKGKDYYQVKARNLLNNADAETLSNQIEKIRSMDSSTLQEYYNKIINNGKYTKKGGAGLGFVEMARAAAKPLDFTISKLDDSFSSFTLKVSVSLTNGNGKPA